MCVCKYICISMSFLSSKLYSANNYRMPTIIFQFFLSRKISIIIGPYSSVCVCVCVNIYVYKSHFVNWFTKINFWSEARMGICVFC